MIKKPPKNTNPIKKIGKLSKNNKYDENNDKILQKTQNSQNVKNHGLQKTFFPIC